MKTIEYNNEILIYKDKKKGELMCKFEDYVSKNNKNNLIECMNHFTYGAPLII